jgi:hypothetical protein
MIQDARKIALRRAEAEGWKRVSITAVKKIGYQDYEVTLVVAQ